MEKKRRQILKQDFENLKKVLTGLKKPTNLNILRAAKKRAEELQQEEKNLEKIMFEEKMKNEKLLAFLKKHNNKM